MNLCEFFQNYFSTLTLFNKALHMRDESDLYRRQTTVRFEDQLHYLNAMLNLY